MIKNESVRTLKQNKIPQSCMIFITEHNNYTDLVRSGCSGIHLRCPATLEVEFWNDAGLVPNRGNSP